ncbi:hypothetical protein CFP56_007755 [Quercus suber]|uniref:Aminotransferase-like plant mobile domain-containing protein n=1 Tax=Quercus suber TaxID=58331 RepID=A0AAW0M6I4_QUESU
MHSKHESTWKRSRIYQAIMDSISGSARQYSWLMHFMESTITKLVFPIAIHLARGNRLALAPAVLASFYRDLSVLKAKIVALIELESYNEKDNGLAITLSAPFELVQNWAWERFETLWY